MDPLTRCERITNKGLKNEYRCESPKTTGGFCDKCSRLNEIVRILEFGCRYIVNEISGTKFRCGKQIDEFGLCTDCLHNRNYISEAYTKYISFQGNNKKCRAVRLTGAERGSYCTKSCDFQTKICMYCCKKKSYETLIKYDFFRDCVPSDRLHELDGTNSSKYDVFMSLNQNTVDGFYVKPRKLTVGKEQNSSCAQDADNFSSKTKNTDPSDNNNNNNDDISSPAKAAKSRNSKQTIPPNKKSEIWTTYVGNLHKSKCYCCGTIPIESTSFSAGHIHPESDGGSLNILNLRPICVSCNASMGTNNMFVYMLQKKMGGWKQALESSSIEIYLHILCSSSQRYSASLEEFHSDYSKWCDEQNTPALSMTVVKYYLIGLTMYDINTERMTLNHKMLQ